MSNYNQLEVFHTEKDGTEFLGLLLSVNSADEAHISGNCSWSRHELNWGMANIDVANNVADVMNVPSLRNLVGEEIIFLFRRSVDGSIMVAPAAGICNAQTNEMYLL